LHFGQMGFQFAGRAVYSAVWVAAVSLFMELLGFSTQKWLTAGGLGTVLLTLAGREVRWRVRPFYSSCLLMFLDFKLIHFSVYSLWQQPRFFSPYFNKFYFYSCCS
jgi:hypothetical protein